MTREEIIVMAHEVGILMRSHEHQVEPTKLERFAALVAAAEREACAEICDRIARRYGEGPELEHYQQGFGDGAFLSAKKIRARGQE